jgi:aminopeptidase N
VHLFLTIFLVITLWPTSVVDITVQSPPTEGLDGCSRAKTARARYSEKADALQLKNVNDPLAGQTDVRHYRLDFEVDLDAQTFSGSTTMTVASRIEDLLIFRFWLNSSMAISSVEVDGEEVEWQRLNETTVDVDLNRSYDEDEVFDIEVSYSGTPVPTWFFSSHDGSRVISTLSSPWYASTWWAVKEDNRDKATGEMLITVPSELTVVSNGVLVAIDSIPGDRRRFHWSTEYPTSPYLFAFAATIYNTFSDGFFYDGGSMPVDFFIYPERDTPDNRDGWLLSVDMLSTFEDLFGPYPFVAEKYAIYNFPFGGGMEHQTATGQGGNHAFGENLTAHELAHQWWGDMVTCATWHDIWLNEGFATYSAALWYEHRSGTRDPEALRQYMAQARPDELDGTVYVYDTSDPDRIFSPDLSYRKAAWVLHMLRGVVGDETIFEILEAFREQHEFSTATTGDFRAVAEDVWGRDLEWVFEEGIYGGGAPAYRHAWREHEVNGQRFLEIMLEQNQNGSVFQMPVEIETFENGQNRSYTIWSDARVEHLLIPVSGEVDDVDLDPDDWILSRTNSLGPFVDGPPKIVAVDPAPLSVLRAGQPLSMTVTFHRDVVAAATDFALRRRDGVEFELAVSYVSGSYTATIDSQGPLPGGRYQLIVSDDVVDAEDGIALDGEIDTANGTGVLPSGDGVAGGDTVVDYIVDGTRRPSRRVTPANLGAKKYRAGD